MTDDKYKRQQRFHELLTMIQVSGESRFRDAVSRLDWLVANLHCTRSTARNWMNPKAIRAVPWAKLRIMEEKLGAKSA